MEAVILGLITKYAQEYPIILTILAVMGSSRFLLKPLFSLFHAFVLQTETKKDDLFLAEVENSKMYKGYVFILDWLFSVKLIGKKK